MVKAGQRITQRARIDFLTRRNGLFTAFDNANAKFRLIPHAHMSYVGFHHAVQHLTNDWYSSFFNPPPTFLYGVVMMSFKLRVQVQFLSGNNSKTDVRKRVWKQKTVPNEGW